MNSPYSPSASMVRFNSIVGTHLYTSQLYAPLGIILATSFATLEELSSLLELDGISFELDDCLELDETSSFALEELDNSLFFELEDVFSVLEDCFALEEEIFELDDCLELDETSSFALEELDNSLFFELEDVFSVLEDCFALEEEMSSSSVDIHFPEKQTYSLSSSVTKITSPFRLSVHFPRSYIVSTSLGELEFSTGNDELESSPQACRSKHDKKITAAVTLDFISNLILFIFNICFSEAKLII